MSIQQTTKCMRASTAHMYEIIYKTINTVRILYYSFPDQNMEYNLGQQVIRDIGQWKLLCNVLFY